MQNPKTWKAIAAAVVLISSWKAAAEAMMATIESVMTMAGSAPAIGPALDEASRTVAVKTELGMVEIGYERLVIALGSTARMLPIPGLAEHAITSRVSAMPSICATTSCENSRRQRLTRPTRRATSPSSSWGQAMPAWRRSPR